MRRGWKLAAGLAVSLLLAGCMTLPQDVRLSGLGADALEAGDYVVAEQHLTEALSVNPMNEHALLNLGVVYHDTGRPELARKTYAEIVRLNRAERAVRVIARQSQGPLPVELARENIADLNLSPVAVLDEPVSMTADTTPIGPVGAATLYTNMSDMYARLQALVESMSAMSDTLRVAALEGDKPEMMAAAKPKAGMKHAGDNAGDRAMDHDKDMAEKPTVITPASAVKDSDAEMTAEKKHAVTIDEDDELIIIASAKAVEPAAGAVRVHIASFRSKHGAERGWNILRQSHHDLLGGLAPHVRKIDFGADMGVFYRLQAGPILTELAAKDLCSKLKGRGLYCSVAFF